MTDDRTRNDRFRRRDRFGDSGLQFIDVDGSDGRPLVRGGRVTKKPLPTQTAPDRQPPPSDGSGAGSGSGVG